MQYKTIVLKLLRQRREYYAQLASQRKALPTMNLLAQELKTHHETWQAELQQAQPGSAPDLIASQALELAVQDLERILPSEPPVEADEPLSLEAAMNFLRRPTPAE